MIVSAVSIEPNASLQVCPGNRCSVREREALQLELGPTILRDELEGRRGHTVVKQVGEQLPELPGREDFI